MPLLLIGLGMGGARLPARGRHRLGGSRRAEPRGRRPPEHRHPVRRVARHGAGRLGLDRRPVGLLPDRDQPRTRMCPRRSRRRRPSSSRPACRSSPMPQLETALQDAGVDAQTTQAIARGERAGAGGRPPYALALLALFAVVALFFTRRVPTKQPEPHPRRRLGSGAGEGNRTPVSSLGSLRSAIEPHPRGPSGRAGRTTSVASDCRSVRPATFPLPCLRPTPISGRARSRASSLTRPSRPKTRPRPCASS